MSEIQILVGSTLGGTEYVAEAAQILIEEAGYDTQLYLEPDLNDMSLQIDQIWLICLATHGAGDYPDNFTSFVDQLLQVNAALSDLNYAIIGVGDSNYDFFCGASKNIDYLLQEMGATNITDRFEIDVNKYPTPEDRVYIWMPLFINALSTIDY
jgi:MioC protein